MFNYGLCVGRGDKNNAQTYYLGVLCSGFLEFALHLFVLLSHLLPFLCGCRQCLQSRCHLKGDGIKLGCLKISKPVATTRLILNGTLLIPNHAIASLRLQTMPSFEMSSEARWYRARDNLWKDNKIWINIQLLSCNICAHFIKYFIDSRPCHSLIE